MKPLARLHGAPEALEARDLAQPEAAKPLQAPGGPVEAGRSLPGIGSSKGGEATGEGEVMSDMTREGSVDPGQRGRTNK